MKANSYGLPNGSGVSYYPDGKPAYEGRWTAGKERYRQVV